MAPAKKADASKADSKTPLSTHLLAGGTAGLAEACACHVRSPCLFKLVFGTDEGRVQPLDTIKVRMQLSRKQKGVKSSLLPGEQRRLTPETGQTSRFHRYGRHDR